MIRFRKWRAGGGLGSDQLGTSAAYQVTVEQPPGSVNTRQVKLWRSDSRYPGQVDVYRHVESGGVVLRFDALRHGAKEPRALEIVDPGAVDTLILSLLQIRGGDWEPAEQPDDDLLQAIEGAIERLRKSTIPLEWKTAKRLEAILSQHRAGDN